MVTRRFKKGSVYETLASRSGFDFSPVVHGHPYWERGEELDVGEQNNCNEFSKEVCNLGGNMERPSTPPSRDLVAPATHEKYPSWPVTHLGMPSATAGGVAGRSRSWTDHSDYPKERASYSRPLKTYSISTQQLQPVSERTAITYSSLPPPEIIPSEFQPSTLWRSEMDADSRDFLDSICRRPSYTEKDYDVPSPPERDIPDHNPDILRPQHLAEVRTGWKLLDSSTPFLDQLRKDPEATLSRWLGSRQQGADLSIDSGVSNKWRGSYSDLSTHVSTRSSLFDSGHSSMPDSGQLSPQSSCDGSTVPEGSTRSQVIAKHGLHRENVVHSSRVQRPKRHESESVLYYDRSLHSSSLEEFRPGLQRVRHLDEILIPTAASSEAESPRSGDEESPFRRNVSKVNVSYDHTSRSYTLRAESAEATPESGGLDLAFLAEWGSDGRRSGSSPGCSNRSSMSEMDETGTAHQRILYLDPGKRHRVSDPELKAIQKQAVLSFYQRQTSKSSSAALEPSSLVSRTPNSNNSATKYVQQESKLSRSVARLARVPEYGPAPVTDVRPVTAHRVETWGRYGLHSSSTPNLSELQPSSLPSHLVPMVGRDRDFSSSSGCLYLKDNFQNGSFAEPAVPCREYEMHQVGLPGRDEESRLEGGRSEDSASRSMRSKSLRKSKVTKQEESLAVPSPSLQDRSGHLSRAERPCDVQVTPTRRVNKPPAPPPPPQPPGRPLPPPPPPTPPPKEQEQDHSADDPELTTLASSSLDAAAVVVAGHSSQCSSPDLPLPPPPNMSETEVTPSDDPLPPPPTDLPAVDFNTRPPLQSIVVYPKNSYMSYKNEKKMCRQRYESSYHPKSLVETNPDASSSNNCIVQTESGLSNISSLSWERLHNIRQQGTTLVFHSDSIKYKSTCSGQNASDVLSSHASKNCNKKSSDQQTPCNNVCGSLCTRGLEATTQAADSVSSLNISCASCLNELLLKEHSQVNVICSIHKTRDTWVKTMAQGETKEGTEFKVDLEDTCMPLLNGTNYSNMNNHSTASTVTRDLPNEKDQDARTTQEDRQSETTGIVIGEDNGVWVKGVPRPVQKLKSREELECERLSEDFVNHCKDSVLKSLLVMSPNHKTVSDYMQGLIDLQPDENLAIHHLDPASTSRNNNNYSFVCKTTISIPLENKREEKVLPANSAYFTTSEPKAKLLTRYGPDMGKQEWTSETELNKKKEELIGSITRKLDIMRAEQVMLREEKAQNEALGNEVTMRVQQLAKPNELEKYHLHIEEMEKIINLLLSISGRLARVQNALMSLGKEANEEERRVLEAKRDKLSSQHEEARRLKESIDRRSQYVSSILHRILSSDEYADYDHFVKMKSKLLMDAREIDEKIKLGEEQLAALRNSVGVSIGKGIFGAS